VGANGFVAGAGWVAETAARTQTTSPTLALLEFPTAELYANLAATQTLLDDSFVNLEEWIASEVEEAFAGQERAAFVNGDGDEKPCGFLDYDAVAEGSYVWGKIGHVLTGANPAYLYGAADQIADFGAPPASLRLRVAQMGENGAPGLNKELTITL
jgi:HK97 family phage major capsid protein